MAEEEGARKGEALPQDLQDFLNDFDQTYEEARSLTFLRYAAYRQHTMDAHWRS